MASRLKPSVVPIMLTIDDIAAKLQLSNKTVRRLIARKKLAAHRIGGQLRVSPDDLLAFIHCGRVGVSV